MEKDGAWKMDNKIKNADVLERVGEGRIMLVKREKMAGLLAKKELPAEGCSRRNGKLEEGSRQKKLEEGRGENGKRTTEETSEVLCGV